MPRVPTSAPLSYRLSEEVYTLGATDAESIPEFALGAMECVTGPAVGKGPQHVHTVACGADPYMTDPMMRVEPFGDDAAGVGTGMKLVAALYSPPARLVGSLAAAYHGYKRNNSVGWALVWSIFGGAAPPITTTIALAQGYGKKK